MQGVRLGAYRIDSELGSGGMGNVYLATVLEDVEDLCAGDRVAVKVVHPHLLAREGFEARFLREGRIGRQVLHDNVVRTFAAGAGEIDGKTVRFLVMEHVEGRSLRALLDEVGSFPEALLREIARQVACGLAAIHAAGVVHRDLKPENVLISEDHRIRIMDLGVARVVEDSLELTREGQFAGSLFYAAPEQFRGVEIAAAADLYSLGVMLYELATGENPFRRDSAADVMSRHLKFDPERLDRWGAEFSPFLAEVVAQLLAKDPDHRFPAASDLCDLFREAESSAWWADRQAALGPTAGRGPRIQIRRDTAVLGREEELGFLRRAWSQAMAGNGNVVLVEGEAGIGKTRLVDEFLAGIDEEGAHLLYGSYPPSGGLGGLSESVLGFAGTAEPEEALLPYLTVTPRLVPAFAAMVKHETPPEGSEPIRGDALHAVFAHLLCGLSEEMPLVWVLDDLHFAGQDSRRIALALARAVRGRRALLLLTARPGVPADELSHFSRLGNFHRLGLSRLSAREVIELLREAFRSENLAEKLGGKIAYKSDGVPFFVFEMIRSLKEGRLLSELEDGTCVETGIIEDIEVPSAVKDLVVARLRDLSDEDRDMLDAAAVQGYRFETGLMAGMCGLPRVRALQRLAAVERRTGLARSAAGLYRFDHHQVQEVLYGEIPAELKTEYHGMLADAIAERDGIDDGSGASGETACQLATHHLASSRPLKAGPFLEAALAHLKEGYRNEAAIELASRALETEGLLSGPARFKVLFEEAGCLGHLGRREREKATLEELGRLAGEDGDTLWRSRAGLELGRHLVFSYQAKPAIEELTKALALSEGLEDQSIRGSILGQLGNAWYTLGEYENAREKYREHLEIAKQAGHRRGIAGATGSLGNISSVLGEREEAEARFRETLEIMREIGDRRGEVSCLLNLGTLHTRAMETELARPRYEEALELALQIGYRRGVAIAYGNLGIMDSHHGELASAQDRYEQCLHISRETGDAEGEGNALLNLSSIRSQLGDLDGAKHLAEESRRVCADAGIRRMEGYALTRLSGAELNREDFAAADSCARAAIALWEEIGYRTGIPAALIYLGEAQFLVGKLEEAAETFDSVLTRTREDGSGPPSVLAACYRSRLPGGDPALAERLYLEHSERLPLDQCVGCMFALFQATGEEAHLEQAYRLLCDLRDRAPEEHRESMLLGVPLYRAIAAAWEERAGA